jgi:hypothetical protein
MAAKPLPSAERLAQLFDYNPETGDLVWRLRPEMKPHHNERWAGTIAGNEHSCGYIYISLGTESFLAHRVIWKMVHGIDPEQIDHINGKRADNRIVNLREVSEIENRRNCKLYSTNTSGVVGVSFDRGRNRWLASIQVMGKGIGLGRFKTFPEALAARRAAELLYGFHPNHGRSA